MLKELSIGKIGRPHGVHGEVKVHVTSDDPRRLERLNAVAARRGGKETVLHITGVRYYQSTAIVRFREWTDPETAACWTGAELIIGREEAIPLGENEYFIGDLIGCRVETEDGTFIGTVKDVLQTGANDVYEVDSPVHGELLLPAIKDCVKELAPQEGRIVITLMKGLIADGV